MAVPETSPERGSGNWLVSFLRDTQAELKKVTWPTKQELISNTIVVLIAVVLCAVLIYVIDTVFSVIFGLLLR